MYKKEKENVCRILPKQFHYALKFAASMPFVH